MKETVEEKSNKLCSFQSREEAATYVASLSRNELNELGKFLHIPNNRTVKEFKEKIVNMTTGASLNHKAILSVDLSM